MANKLSLGLVIGGAVDSSLGAAFKNVSGEMKKLEAQTTRAKGLQKVIGETMRLREEVAMLKERLQVLERITVEKENSLAKEIESLRDR